MSKEHVYPWHLSIDITHYKTARCTHIHILLYVCVCICLPFQGLNLQFPYNIFQSSIRIFHLTLFHNTISFVADGCGLNI